MTSFNKSGDVYLVSSTKEAIIGYVWLGQVASLSIATTLKIKEYRESKDTHIADFSMALEHFDTDILNKYIFGVEDVYDCKNLAPSTYFKWAVKGLNMANTVDPILIQFYKVKCNPVIKWPKIDNNINNNSLNNLIEIKPNPTSSILEADKCVINGTLFTNSIGRAYDIFKLNAN